ncbi:MAG: GTPase [Alphaproteobacteria bacterium]
MRLKSFHGATLTEAMRLVREALGEDAIIVATREDDNGGMRVTAAVDEVSASTKAASLQAPAPASDGSNAMEIIAEALTRHQVPSALAEKIMATATQFASDDPLLALGAALDMHFKFQPVADPVSEHGASKPLMLVGPPGAGKTLCIAKFATRSMLSKKKPTVISTDLERAGGMEQLAAFTRVLKLNLVEIEDWNALRDVVEMQKSGTVLIDTAGRNPFDDGEKETIREYVAAVGDATLVLPAGLDATEAIDLAQEFKRLGATRLIVTRIDAVKRLGSLLRIAYETKLPFANYCASYKVTEPPWPLNPVVLARLVLQLPGTQAATQTKKDAPKSAYGAVQ